MHVTTQLVPSQLTPLALAGLVHALQLGPHVETELVSEQTPPHRLNPDLQLNPHVLLMHVAVAGSALGSVGVHGEHAVPQVAGELSSAHVVTVPETHAWKFVLHVGTHLELAQVTFPFVGAAHAVVQLPQ